MAEDGAEAHGVVVPSVRERQSSLQADESASMLTETILGVTPEQSGAFLDVDGSPFTP